MSKYTHISYDENGENDENDAIHENQDKEIVQKLGTILINNGWNDKNESIVISIGENAASYKWMHEKSANRYITFNKILTIIMIILSSMLSVETIIPSDTLAITVIRQLITYSITVLSVVNNFLNYEKLTEQHLAVSMKFSGLYHDIQQQMCMYRQDRQNAIKYVSNTLKKYDSLIVNGPQITNKILVQFKNIFKNSDISMPGIADKIQKIEIIQEEIPLNKLKPVVINDDSISLTNIDKDIKLQGNNLSVMHDVFRVTGDIYDNDLKNIDKKTIQKYLKDDFERERWKVHSEYD